MKRIFKWLGLFILLAVIVVSCIFMYNWRDRHPDYSIDVTIENKNQSTIKAGFAKKPITPTIVDTWNDANANNKYNEDDGDTYNDNNTNGKFDAFWIAGMSNAKPAQGVHDDVWSRVMVLDDGKSRIAMISMDAIGFLHNDVIDIRNRIPEELGIDYALLSSTHTHESNDLVGIWGENMFNSGVNLEMMAYVKGQTVANNICCPTSAHQLLFEHQANEFGDTGRFAGAFDFNRTIPDNLETIISVIFNFLNASA